LSYYKALARPGFSEMILMSDGEFFREIGDRTTRTFFADNLDLRYELYPGGADQIFLGVLEKHSGPN
jgi:hypothetical protein